MDPLEDRLNQIQDEASRIPVQFLPGWVRDHICHLLDPEATTSVRDYRGLGELLGLTPVHVRSIRANNNGGSVTDAILKLFDSTLSIWDLIFCLRQMRVGAVREILQAWPEICRRYNQCLMPQMRSRPGMEGYCRCPNCQPPGGSTCYPYQQTSHPGCSCYEHNQAMNCYPQPRQTPLKGGQDGVSYNLHGDQAYRNWDRNRRTEHGHSGQPARDTQSWGQTRHGHVAGGTDTYGQHFNSTQYAAMLEGNQSNEDNCSYFGPNLVHRVFGERQGAGGMCQEESRGEAGTQGMGQDSQQGMGRDSQQGMGRDSQQGMRRDSQQGMGRESQQGMGRDSQQAIGTAGQERRERAEEERGQENLENRLHQLDVMENFLPPDDPTSLSGGQDLSQGITVNNPSEMAHLQNNNNNHSPVPDNNQHIHLHFPEHQRDQGFPEIRDNFDQTVRKMACSTSDLHHQRQGQTLQQGQHGFHASLPQTQINMHLAAPVQHVINPCCSEGIKQQSNQSPIARTEVNEVQEKVPVVKMRESSRNLDTEEAREKRNSDPTSSASLSYSDLEGATQPPGGARQGAADQQTGYRASNDSGTLRRQKSDELVYQQPSDVIKVTTPESELGKFVFITGGERQQSNQVEKEIWRLCKKLYGEGITVVADLPRGIVTMPLDPLAVRCNMRHNINEAVHGYFQKATCVILAVSPGYRDYVDSRSNPVSPSSHHNSARFIYTNMMNEYCQKNFCRNKRFYPVMLKKVSGRKEHIPDWLTSTLTYTFPANNSELVRHLKDDLK